MLATKLRQIIDDRHWSIETVSKLSGVHRDIISRILREETTDPRWSTMKRIAGALGVGLDDLAGCNHGEE